MIKISPASPFVPVSSDLAPGTDTAKDAAPPDSAEPAAAIRQRSLADQATTASRTRLGTFELSKAAANVGVSTHKTLSVELHASSSSALPPLNRTPGVTPGRSRGLKNTVYQPSKRRNDDFNGKVNLAPAEADDKHPMGVTHVVCRHLAFAYFMTAKKADFLNQVKDKAGIERYFSNGNLHSANQGVKGLRSGATLSNSRVVSAGGLPSQLIDIVQTMRHARQPNADFLITTSNHALALNIQIKDQGRVCLTTYDPNTTTNHFRVEAKDHHDHEVIGSIAHNVSSYSMLGNHAFTLYAKGDVFPPQAALSYMEPTGISSPRRISSAFINHALDRNDPALIRQLIAKAASDHPRGGPGLKDALAANEHGFPGMFAALQNGRSHTVGAWMEGVRNLAAHRLLTPNDVVDLFKVQGASSGQSGRGLNTAMQAKKAGAVSAYMVNVTEAAGARLLTTAQVKDLFSAPDHWGTPAINAFWEGGAPKLMGAVVPQLERCYRHGILTSADVKELLLGHGPQMSSTAMADADSKAFEALAGMLQPLVSNGALHPRDILDLATAHGYVAQPARSRTAGRPG